MAAEVGEDVGPSWHKQPLVAAPASWCKNVRRPNSGAGFGIPMVGVWRVAGRRSSLGRWNVCRPINIDFGARPSQLVGDRARRRGPKEVFDDMQRRSRGVRHGAAYDTAIVVPRA